MAILGLNSELPLPDLLTTLRNQHGRLSFTDLGPIGNLEIFIAPNTICGFFSDNKSLTDESVILEKLVGVTASDRGRFHFEALPGEMINPRTRLHIDGVNLAVATMVDEINCRREDFISAAKMVVLNQMGCQFDDAMVASFFGRNYELFEIGVDAQQLAIKSRISLTQAQFYILKYIEAGAVKVGLPQSGRRGRPSPIVVQSSRFNIVTTRRLRGR